MSWMQTASGIEFDLVRPTARMVVFDDVAEHLAKIARFAGATPGVFYSVAEHCCRAADAVFAKTGDPTLAAYVLLHDAHEAYIVDRITPERWAEEEIAQDFFGDLGAAAVKTTPRLLRYRIDEAIHAAAWLPFPLSAEMQASVKMIDLVMLRTEKRDLMKASRDWPLLDGVAELPEIICPWDWETAKRGFLRRVQMWVPSQCGRVTDERSNPQPPHLNQSSQLAHGKTPSVQGGSSA